MSTGDGGSYSLIRKLMAGKGAEAKGFWSGERGYVFSGREGQIKCRVKPD
jgi:hypothetical protein